MSNIGYMLATASESGTTVQDGINVVLESLQNITQLVTTYPFNIYFGCGILCMGIGIFAMVKHVF